MLVFCCCCSSSSSSCLSLALASFALLLHPSWGLCASSIHTSIYIYTCCCVRIFFHLYLCAVAVGVSVAFIYIYIIVSFVCGGAQVAIVSHTWLPNGNSAKTNTRVYDLSPIDLSGVQCVRLGPFLVPPPPPLLLFFEQVWLVLWLHTHTHTDTLCLSVKRTRPVSVGKRVSLF